jgi:beta-fructofuranosidase
MPILFRPAAGVAADVIPFRWRDEFHLFYLQDWRDPAGHGEGTPWWHLSTRDFVTYRDHGEAIPRGPVGSHDQWVFTGCVVEDAGRFHAFYTGHNFHFPKVGRAQEAVLRATSDDLERWTKDAGFALSAPAGYEVDDWRDPFVFRDPESGGWGMLLAARRTAGPSRQRGCLAYATSPDLTTWTVREPFWTPEQFFTHECPDLFRIGDWWYLVFSEFSDRTQTRYRMARSWRGPWLCPPDDAFDTRAWYAAKTVADGARRFAIGWLATREQNADDRPYQWGGDLVAHELVQRADGTLASRLPATVAAAFAGQRVLPAARPVLGTWREGATDATGRTSVALVDELPDECLIEATVTLQAGTNGAGLLLRAGPDGEAGYQLRLEPHRQRLVLDRWPRPGDQPAVQGERPLALVPGRPVRLQVLISGSCLVAYADGATALSSRIHLHRSGALGLFASDGPAAFSDLAVRTRG